jgi:hypothetical protein
MFFFRDKNESLYIQVGRKKHSINVCPQAGQALPCLRQAGFSNPCPSGQAGMKRKQKSCQNEPSAGRFDGPRTRFDQNN